jgi:hypothetical protein
MSKINSRTDWLLDSCYYNCFICGAPFSEPPQLDKNGVLRGKALWFNILDEYGDKVETEERICRKCWVSDLSQFGFADDID